MIFLKQIFNKRNSKDFLGNFSFEIHKFILKLSFPLLITFYYGISDFGIYTFVNILSLSLAPIISLGLNKGFQYQISTKKFDYENVIFTALISSLIPGFIVAIAIFLLYNTHSFGVIGNSLDLDLIIFLIILCFLRFSNISIDLCLKGASYFKLFRKSNLVKLYFNFIFLLLSVSLSIDFKYFLILLLFPEFIKIFYSLLTIKPVSLKVNKIFFKKSFNFGIKSWFGSLSQITNNKIDQIFASLVINTELLGTYSLTLNLLQFMNFIPSALAPIALNSMVRNSNVKRKIKVLMSNHKISFYSSLVLLIFYLVFITISIPYIKDFNINQLLKLTFIFSPGLILFISSRRILNKYFDGINKPQISSYVQLVGSFFTILLLIILFKISPTIYSLAFATTIGYVLASLYAYYMFIKINSFDQFRRLFFLPKLSDFNNI